jgi:hypothetical protein
MGSNQDIDVDSEADVNKLPSGFPHPENLSVGEHQSLNTLSKHILQKLCNTCDTLFSTNDSVVLQLFSALTISGNNGSIFLSDNTKDSLDIIADRIEQLSNIQIFSSFMHWLCSIHFRLKVERYV